MKRKQKPTHAEIAEKHGIHRVTVTRYAAAGVDVYDDEAIRIHRKETDIDRELKEAQLEKARLEIEKIALSIAVTNAEHYPKEEVEAGFAFMAALDGLQDQAMISEFPSLVAGMSAPQVEVVVRKFLAEWGEKKRNARGDVVKSCRDRVIKDMRGDMKKVAASQENRSKANGRSD